MVNESQRRRLIEAYREAPAARAVIVRSAAGLLALALIAVLGLAYGEAETTSASVTASRDVSGR